MVLGVVCVLASIVALAVLDQQHRAGGSRGAWRRFLRVGVVTWLADIGVIGTLLLWHVIGAISSDDGYNLTIARVVRRRRIHAPTTTGSSAPPKRRSTGTSRVLAHLASISTAGVWMRLPATAGRRSRPG